MLYPIHSFISVSVIAVGLVFGIYGCLQPADEILQKSDQAGKIVFVKQASVGKNRNSAMAANPDEFYPGTDIFELTPISPSGKLTNLTGAYTRGSYPQNRWGAAEDPEISNDGKKMLFSMRKGGEAHWHLYEIDLDSRVLTELTTPPTGDDIDPAYLPDGNIVFTSTRNEIVDEYERRRAPQLFLGIREQNLITNTRQLSFNQSHDQNPFVHSSGLVIFTRWDHLGNPNKMPLFSIHPDGTKQFVYYGADEVFGGTALTSGMRTFMEARELSDGGVVASIMERTSNFEGGSICIIDPASGMSAKPQIITSTPYNFEGKNITVDGIFKSPFPIMDNGKERLLVAQSTHETGGQATGDANFDLFVMDKDGSHLQTLHLDPNFNDYDPVVVIRRTPPAVLPTDPNVLEGLTSKATTGFFFDADVYSRDRNLDGQPTPTLGDLKFLRVLEAIPLAASDALRGGSIGETNFEKQRVVGYSDIKDDGSFAIEVPALKSLHVQTLDANAMMVVNQLQWIHVQPGEKRKCTGCHGSREKDALITHLITRNNDSVTLDSTKTYLARFSQAAQVWKHSAAKTDTLDFYDPRALRDSVTTTRTNTVQAIFDRNCTQCHSSATAKDSGGGLVLQETQLSPTQMSMRNNETISSVYKRLAVDSNYKTSSNSRRPLVDDNGARKSPLTWVMYNKQLDGSNTASFRTLTKNHTELWKKDGAGNILPFDSGNADLLTLIEWMDMGIQFSNTTGYRNRK